MHLPAWALVSLEFHEAIREKHASYSQNPEPFALVPQPVKEQFPQEASEMLEREMQNLPDKSSRLSSQLQAQQSNLNAIRSSPISWTTHLLLWFDFYLVAAKQVKGKGVHCRPNQHRSYHQGSTSHAVVRFRQCALFHRGSKQPL